MKNLVKCLLMTFTQMLVTISFFSLAEHAVASPTTVNGLYTNAFGRPGDQPVLFLHGGPGYNSYSFEYSNAQMLADRGYHVVVFDQRGAGRSANAPLAEYAFKNAVADVEAVVEHYRLQNMIVLGHSYGGTLAVKYVQKFASRVKATLLIDAPMDQQAVVGDILTNCEANYIKSADAADLGYIRQLRDAIFANGQYVMNFQYGGFVFFHAGRCGLYTPHQSNPERDKIELQLKMAPRVDLLSLSTSDPFHGLIENEHWLSGSVLIDLEKLGPNVYGIFGTDDGLFRPVHLTEIKDALPVGHFKQVDGASHNLFIDQRSTFLDYVDFVAGRMTSAKE